MPNRIFTSTSYLNFELRTSIFAIHYSKLISLLANLCNALAISTDKLYAGTSGMGVWQMNATGVLTGIHPVEGNVIPLEILPNPANKDITIYPGIKEAKSGLFFIYDLMGHLMHFQKVIINTESTIGISAFPAGTYFIRGEIDGKVYGGMFVKQ